MIRGVVAGSVVVLPLLWGCSEGTEVGDNEMSASGEPEPAADDDGASDDDAATTDDDSATDDATDDDSAADDDATEPGGPETLVDVTTAMRDMADYETTKEYLTDTAVLEVSEDEGDPAPSLRIELPFTNYNQFIEFQYLADQVNGGVYWDLEGKILSFKLKVEAAGYTNPECPGGIRVFIKAGESYAYAGRSWLSTPAASPEWRTYDFDLALAELGDGVTSEDLVLSDVRSIGFGFESADCGGMFAPGDPPPETDPPTTAIFYLDDITVRNAGL